MIIPIENTDIDYFPYLQCVLRIFFKNNNKSFYHSKILFRIMAESKVTLKISFQGIELFLAA